MVEARRKRVDRRTPSFLAPGDRVDGRGRDRLARGGGQALGEVRYGPTEAEQKSLVFRRSIYVAEDIAEGELFTTKNIRIVRPGNGAPPSFYKQILGLQARICYQAGTPLDANTTI